MDIIYLHKGCDPPRDDWCLIIEWSSVEGSSFKQRQNSLYYKIGPKKHKFWRIEALNLAKRMKFEKIYYIARPTDSKKSNLEFT